MQVFLNQNPSDSLQTLLLRRQSELLYDKHIRCGGNEEAALSVRSVMCTADKQVILPDPCIPSHQFCIYNYFSYSKKLHSLSTSGLNLFLDWCLHQRHLSITFKQYVAWSATASLCTIMTAKYHFCWYFHCVQPISL